MATLTSPSSTSADLRPRAASHLAAAICCLAALSVIGVLALLLLPMPAGALVTPVLAPQYGIEPHSATPFTAEPTLPLTYHGGPVMHSNNTYVIYWDGTTNPAGQYDGDWKTTINEYFQAVGSDSGFLNNVFAVAQQYKDSSGGHAAYSSTFRGAATDTTPFPAGECTDPAPSPENIVCLTDAQLRAHLTSFISAHSLPTGLGTIYFLLTPPGVTVCTDGGTTSGHCSDFNRTAKEISEDKFESESFTHSFCGYHSFTGSGAGTILYAAQPWTAGDLGTGSLSPHNGVTCQGGSGVQQEPNQLQSTDTDGDFDSGLPDVIINDLSTEQLATETDPLLNGWYAPSGAGNAGNETPDQCRNWFEPKLGGSASANTSETNDSEAGTLFNQAIAGHVYELNTAYDQAALSYDYPGVACITGVALVPKFTAPNPVNSGDVVGLDATESDVSLGATNFTWNFGDGSAPVSSGAAASVFHSFTYGGVYEVSLTVTDGGGNVSSVANDLTVVGPPPPSPGQVVTPGPGASNGTSGSSGAGAAAGAGAGAHAKPLATQAVVSRKLADVLRGGLVVRYSVNEQVAGRFEVLLASSIARRLGLNGARATGLAPGTAPQTVIAKAILVTTKAGRSTFKIQFGKTTAARLRRLRKVSLMLRLVVHNAASGSTTVLNTVTLTP